VTNTGRALTEAALDIGREHFTVSVCADEVPGQARPRICARPSCWVAPGARRRGLAERGTGAERAARRAVVPCAAGPGRAALRPAGPTLDDRGPATEARGERRVRPPPCRLSARLGPDYRRWAVPLGARWRRRSGQLAPSDRVRPIRRWP
jgi:hypothetical protein